MHLDRGARTAIIILHMSIFRPRFALIRGIGYLFRGVVFLLTLPWVRRQVGKVARKAWDRKMGKRVVDADGKIVS